MANDDPRSGGVQDPGAGQARRPVMANPPPVPDHGFRVDDVVEATLDLDDWRVVRGYVDGFYGSSVHVSCAEDRCCYSVHHSLVRRVDSTPIATR